MHIYHLELTLQDTVYFATRELGRLYATENYLHNYALTYALGLAKSSYHDSQHIPHYQEDLEPLNQKGIYVTPAQPVNFAYVTHTYKWADLRYQVRMVQSSVNLPTFGRIREIAPESVFECFIISHHPLQLPKWIRLGKWMSKAEVKLTELSLSKQKEDLFIYPYPLNPLDVMFTHQVIGYDVINMPPVSLIRNVRMRGEYYQISDRPDLKIPARLSYRFG
ncbi:MAG: type I-D CRISPR-associated protein Cas5/Csc1 [Microcystis aeruginosa]